MKKYLVLMVICSIIFISSCKNNEGSSKTFGSSNGKLGEVRYSVPNSEQFVKENGKGWALMDGRNINNSYLFKLSNNQTLPEGDPDGDREVGKQQRDEFKSHTHQYTDAHFAESNCGNQHLFGNKGDSDNDNGRCAHNSNYRDSRRS